MPDRMPEDMSDRMPEDLPVRKCINVMVGITQSKVIWYIYTFPQHKCESKHEKRESTQRIQDLGRVKSCA